MGKWCSKILQVNIDYTGSGSHNKTRVTLGNNITQWNILSTRYCEDKDCEWTYVLESVVLSMNATPSTALPVHHLTTSLLADNPNTGLPKLFHNELASNNPTAYGMQINALLAEVQQCSQPQTGFQIESTHVQGSNTSWQQKATQSATCLTCLEFVPLRSPK